MKPEDSMYYHESGELYAEDVDQHMAVLPEIVSSTEEVTILISKWAIREFL